MEYLSKKIKMKRPSKKTWVRCASVGLIVVLFGIIFLPHISHAAVENELLSGLFGGILDFVVQILIIPLVVVTSIIMAFLGLSGIILDYAIKYSVTDLTKNIANIPGISTTWKLIRDLCNMSFIFVLVYNGIMTIFTSDNKAKKIIVPVIIAVLLINFSLFLLKSSLMLQILSPLVFITSYTKRAWERLVQWLVASTSVLLGPL